MQQKKLELAHKFIQDILKMSTAERNNLGVRDIDQVLMAVAGRFQIPRQALLDYLNKVAACNQGTSDI